MAVTLSTSLRDHQAGDARQPAVRVRARGIRGGHEVLRWTLEAGSGSPTQAPVAALITNAGTLLWARVGGTNMGILRNTNPVPGTNFTSFPTQVSSMTSGSGVALAKKATGSTVTLLFNKSGDIRFRDSTNDGASWGTETVMDTYASACHLAMAYAPEGSGCAFWNEGATVYRKRRAANGTWGTRTAWTESLASVSGLAVAYYDGDYHVLVTGVDSAGAAGLWGTVFGDTLVATDTWTSLRPLAWSDADGSVTFRGPHLVALASDQLRATVVLVEAGPVAIDRVYELHGRVAAGVNGEWSEPVPHEAVTCEAAIAVGASYAYFCQSGPVWIAGRSTGWTDLSARVSAASYRIGAEYSSCRVELDDADGAALGSGQLFVGGTIEVAAGYLSGAAAAAEYGAVVSFVVGRIRRTWREGRRVVVVEGHGIWEELAGYRQQVSWQVASGELSRGDVLTRVLAHAGYGLTQSGPAVSAQWGGYSPAFAMGGGESGDAGARRVLAVVSDVVRFDNTTEGYARGTSASEAADWELGGAGEHPVELVETVDEGGGPAAWVRVVGPDRFADAHDWGAVYARGAQWRTRGVATFLRALDVDAIERARDGGERRRWVLRDLEANTDDRAEEWAEGALRQVAVREEVGRVTMPWHAGLQLWDVVSVTSAPVGWSNEPGRVLELGLDYERGAKRRAKYDARLVLGKR